MKSISKIKSSSIVAITAILLCIAAAFAMLANFAFANEVTDPTPPDPKPANNYNVTFNFAGLQPEAKFHYELHGFNDEIIPYYLGEQYSVPENAKVNCQTFREMVEVHIFTETESNEADWGIRFIYYTPMAYDIDKIEPQSISEIAGDTNFVVTYKPYTGTYNLTVKVYEGFSEADVPFQGYNVSLYDSNSNFVKTEVSDSEGLVHFNGLTANQAGGHVLGRLDNYTDDLGLIDDFDYRDDYSATVELSVFPASEASMQIISKDPHHNYFKFQVDLSVAGDPPFLIDSYQLNYDSFTGADQWASYGDYVVKEDGTLYGAQYDEEEVTYIMETYFRPACEDGYTFQYWTIDLGTGEKAIYKPGDTFTISTEDKFFAEAFYSESPVVPDEPQVAAQTGDNTIPAVVLIGVAVMAGAVALLAARKRKAL